MELEAELRVVKPGDGRRLEPDLPVIDQALFIAALERSREALLREVDARLHELSAPARRLAISSQGETEYIPTEKIVRLEASGCYTHIYVEAGRKLTSCRALGEYETLLNDREFARVHHGHLVNLAHILLYQKKDGYALRMSDNYLVPVAVRRREAFEAKMKDWIL